MPAVRNQPKRESGNTGRIRFAKVGSVKTSRQMPLILSVRRMRIRMTWCVGQWAAMREAALVTARLEMDLLWLNCRGHGSETGPLS